MHPYPRNPSPSLPIPMPAPLAVSAAQAVAIPAVVVPAQPRPTGAQAMPTFSYPSAPVTPAEHIAKGTGKYVLLGYVALAIAILVATAGSAGMALLLIPIGLIAQHLQAKTVRALIRGSGVQVTPSQMPQLYAVVERFAQRLGMKEVPEVYIVEAAVQNGFAVKLGKRDLVLLTDDVVWGALQSRDPHAIGFVIGHELAHVALGHTGALRGMLRTAFKPLSRADELTCDNVAAALVGNADIAVHGVTLLTVGPQLLAYLNDAALLEQAEAVCSDKYSKKAEKKLTHPLLLKRIGNLKGFA